MNVNEYIASGVVDLYAMNALSGDEKKEFDRLMVLYPEIALELRKTEEMIESFAMSHAINPRPQLRSEILKNIESAGGFKKEARVIPIKTDHSLAYKYLIAACLAALVVSTFASWFFYTRWDEAEERYTSLLNEKNELAENYNFVKATYDATVENLVVMRDENANIITLHATDSTRRYMARVYWNKSNQHSYIDVLSLPAPGEGKQFELWALVGGKPVDAGVFAIDGTGPQRVKDITAADMWAVTLEPKGGSVSPTMDQMYLISKAGG